MNTSDPEEVLHSSDPSATDTGGATSEATAEESTTSEAVAAAEPGAHGNTTFLFVDVSPWEANPNWNILVNTPNFYGAILKATQGIKGYNNDGGWFQKHWPLVKEAASDRYGDTWFRGAYLFLNLWQDGAAQADNYLEIIDTAGGWDRGDIIPIVDVELGNDGSDGKHKRNKNQDVSKQQIIDCTTQCAERLKEVTGRNVMLYGRGAMRDRGINDKMGCDVVFNPSYTSRIVMNGLEAWTIDDVVLWQYCGDGDAALPDEAKFPRTIPGFGNADISVYIEGKNKPSFENLKRRLGIT